MKTRNFLIGFMLLGATAVYAQVPNKWEDSNGDGFYDIEEFSKVYSKGYNDLDIDRDGRINDQEFYDGTYNNLDVNRDGRLTNEEWTSGNRYYGQYVPADRYSQNTPQYLSRSEFAKRFKDSGFYQSYDENNDGFITSDELNISTFRILDTNQDGKLDAAELKDFQ